MENIVKVIDHAACGTLVAKRPLPLQLQPVIQKVRHMFQEKLQVGLPPFCAADHRILLADNYHILTHKVHQMSPIKEIKICKQLDAYFALSHIEPACSPFGAGVMFVPKKEGTLRMCVDYRVINKITLADRYPMHRIDERLDTMASAK